MNTTSRARGDQPERVYVTVSNLGKLLGDGPKTKKNKTKQWGLIQQVNGQYGKQRCLHATRGSTCCTSKW